MESLLFYCAAGVKAAVEPVALEYEKLYGTKIQLQYAGSGTLLGNIQASGKGDLYLAGDDSYIRIAREKGFVAESIPLALMHPVIAVRDGNSARIATIDDIIINNLRIALCNPDAASIGKQTRMLLQRTGQWVAIEGLARRKGVFKPTVEQVANDIKLGTVDAGIIWDATATRYPELDTIHVAAFDDNPKMITVGILTQSEHPSAALRFARYLGARDRGLVTFEANGYHPVRGDDWVETPSITLMSGGVSRAAIERTIDEFERREGATVLTVFNGCGILVGEMRAGKRPDAYFACDTSYMTGVMELFKEPLELTETDMVIIVAAGNPKDIRNLEDLGRIGIRVAAANANYSALGSLTDSLLRRIGLHQSVHPNITYGDAPTADYLTVRVRTGREDAAIVYRANTIGVSGDVEVIEIDKAGARAVQPIAVSRDSRHPRLAGRLIEALSSDRSRERFAAAGFNWRAVIE